MLDLQVGGKSHRNADRCFGSTQEGHVHRLAALGKTVR